MRSRAAVGPQGGAAEGAEEVQQLDDHGYGVGRARLDAAHAHLLRPQPELDALPGVLAAQCVTGQVPGAPTRTRPGPATSASNMFMAPTKSATKAELGRA